MGIGPERSMTELRQSKYVFDFNRIYEAGEGRRMVGVVSDYIRANNLKFDFVVGHHLRKINPLPHNGDHPLIRDVAKSLGKPVTTFYEYEGGNTNGIEGNIPDGKAIVVTDVVRTGDTIIKTANQFKALNANLEITDAVAVISRPSGDKRDQLIARLADEGIQFHYLVTAQELVMGLLKNRNISPEQFYEIMQDDDFSHPDILMSTNGILDKVQRMIAS